MPRRYPKPDNSDPKLAVEVDNGISVCDVRKISAFRFEVKVFGETSRPTRCITDGFSELRIAKRDRA